MVRPLLMMHVRKTAGSGLRQLLINRFAVGRYLVDAHSEEYARADLDQYDFLAGHMSVADLGRFRRRPTLMVVLRDPIDRALSAFHFFRGNDDAFLRGLAPSIGPGLYEERRQFTALARELPLYDFLTRHPDLARRHLSNVFTRAMLADAPKGELRPVHVEEAKTELEAFDVVGLTENLADTMTLVEDTMGWQGLGPVERYNQNRSRPSIATEDPRALAILREWNAMDTELDACARRMFADRLSAVRTRRASGDAVPGGCVLPNARAFTFDQPIHGEGWYPREHHGGAWISWTGQTSRAWIDLGLDAPVASVLSCRIPHAATREHIGGVRASINDQVVELSARAGHGAVILEASVPAAFLERGRDRVRIAFATPAPIQPRPPAETSIDPRFLGIALDAIQLVPVSG